jgi:hypothetical protein
MIPEVTLPFRLISPHRAAHLCLPGYEPFREVCGYPAIGIRLVPAAWLGLPELALMSWCCHLPSLAYIISPQLSQFREGPLAFVIIHPSPLPRIKYKKRVALSEVFVSPGRESTWR